jgi:hypothetical protein
MGASLILGSRGLHIKKSNFKSSKGKDLLIFRIFHSPKITQLLLPAVTFLI